MSSYSNTSESLGEREMLWEHEPNFRAIHSLFMSFIYIIFSIHVQYLRTMEI